MRLSPCLFATLLGVAGIALAPPARAEGTKLPALPVLPAETIRLANGLKVLLAPDPGARLASVLVSYAAGFADDPNGKRGLAHLVEHLVSQHTKHSPSLFRVLESAGASSFNAMTELDKTTYFESVPPERLANALWVESERMGFAAAAVTEEAVTAERAVVGNEDRGKTHDRKLAVVDVVTGDELFPSWHPYSVIGVGAADLDDIGAADVLAFLRTWYTPQNATLAIAGRFDRDVTVALVKRYFESIPSVAPPARPRLPDSSVRGVELSLEAALPTNSVLLEWRTPALGARDDAALDLAATALAGAGNERFSPALVASHLVVSVGARQQSERQASRFIVQADAAPGVAPPVVAHALQEAIDDFARGLTLTEVARAREILRQHFLRLLESPPGRARLLASAAELGLEVGPSFDWGLARYDTLRDEDVRRAVATWLNPAHRLALTILAKGTAPGRGRLTSREEVTK